MTIAMIIYLAITAGVLALCVWCLVSERRPTAQATAAMVAVPLLLRLFLVK